MDAVTLDHLVAELSGWLVGLHLGRPRAGASGAVLLEVSRSPSRRLWIDAGRGTAGVYSVSRETARRLGRAGDDEPTGRARQALLHLRKHLDGARVTGLARVPGERTVVVETSGGTLVLRLSGPAPALTLARDHEALGTLGDGPPAWPPPSAAPEREWDRLSPADFEVAVSAARASGRSLARSVLSACPGLGPVLARETDGSARSFAALVERLRAPRPTLSAPGPRETWHDSDLGGDAVVLLPIPLDRPGAVLLHPASWLDAAEVLLEARRRGLAFERRRLCALAAARRRLRRLEHLERNLDRDLAGAPDSSSLRREAEALLAFSHGVAPGVSEVVVPDPYEPERRLRIRVNPMLGGVANAEARFDKARRAGRATQQITVRLRETRSALEAERRRERLLLEARDGVELAAHEAEPDAGPSHGEAPRSPRLYLTSHGLAIHAGRSASENHHLTFRVARPEDLWLHARDVPGSHVILRDPEGRAGADDLREAAEVAAFFSDARKEALVDVHVTRRKHVRPARGGPGRVFVGHSDTLRVAPRDPEGRLRRR